jgi:hypothetical protein
MHPAETGAIVGQAVQWQELIALAHRMVLSRPGNRDTMSNDDAFWLDYCDRAAALCCLLTDDAA